MTTYLLTLFGFMVLLFLYVLGRGLGLLRLVLRTEEKAIDLSVYNRHSLYRRLPLLDVLDAQGVGLVVRKDGSFAAGFHLPGVASFYFDAPALNALSTQKEALFRKIPVSDALKLSFYYRIRHDVSAQVNAFYVSNEKGAPRFINFLNDNYRRFLEENNTTRKFRTVKLLAIVQYRPDTASEAGGFRLFLRTFWEGLLTRGLWRFPAAFAAAYPYLQRQAIVQRRVEQHEKALDAFQTHFAAIRQALASVYDTEAAKVEPLSQEAVERLLFESLNPGLSFDDYRDFSGEHPTDRFYHTDVFDNRRYVNVGGQLRAVLSLTRLPAWAAPGAFRAVTLGNQDLDFVFHYKNPPPGRKRRTIALQEKMEKQRLIPPEGPKTGALVAQRAVTEAEELLSELDRGEKLLGELEAQIVLYAPGIAHNLKELQDAEHVLAADVLAVENKLRSIQGATIYREGVATLPYVLYNLPFLTPVENTGRALDCLSSWAAKLLPDENIHPRADLSQAKALLVTERQELYGFDPFCDARVPNYNLLIAGAPGTGKSVFARKLLSRLLYKQPLRILTLTRGDDWDDFFTALGGAMIPLDPDRGRVLNILDCPGGSPSESFKRTLIGVLLYMTKEEDDGLASLVLSGALDELYRKARIIGSKPTVSDLQDTLRTFHHESEAVETRARLLAVKLTPFCAGGEYGKLFDTPTHPDFYKAAGSLGFDLDKLGRDGFLESIYALILPAFIDAQVRAKDAATVIVYDEGWSFLQNPALRRVLEANFRTARKHAAGIWALTQHYEDFKDHGTFIYDTTATKVILRQEKSLDFLQKSLGLTDAETRRVATLPAAPQTFAEYLLLHGAEKVFIRDYSTEFDLAAFGSKRPQIEERRAAFAAGDPVQAVYALARGLTVNKEEEVTNGKITTRA